MHRSIPVAAIVLSFASARSEPYLRYPLQPVRRGTGYSTEHAFDFGRKSSTVREGFKPVTVETVLSDDAQYGWRDKAGLRDYYARDDYRAKNFPVDVLYCPYQALALNDFNDDCVWGKSPAELHIRLPEGKYNVYYMGGVPRGGGFRGGEYFKFDIVINDTVKDTICIPFSTMFENRRYTVDVGDQGLTIKLTPVTTWIIDGLIVYPAAEERNVEECIIAPLEEDVYLLPPYSYEKGMRTIEKVAHDDTGEMPELTAAQKRKGHLVFTRDWVERIFPNTAPHGRDIGRPVSMFATPGEWEPACFTVRALDRPCDVTDIAITAPRSPEGQEIPAANVRLYRVHYAWLSLGTGRGYNAGRSLKAKVAPYLLAKDVPWRVPAATNQPYWLNVKIPDDAAPGFYEGRITVKTGGAPATDLGFRVRVLPFKLKARPDFVYGVYWSPIWNYVKRNYRDEAMREEGRWREEDELQDFKEHLVDCFTYGHFGRWKIDLEKRTVEPEDPTFPGMAEAVRLWKRAGCNGPIISTPVKVLYWQLAKDLMESKRPEGMKYGQQWHRKDTDVPPVVVELMAKGARIVQDHVKKMGYPDFLYYILDESDPKLMRKLYRAVKQVPGARTYTTSGNYPEDIGPWLDVNCSIGSFLSRGDWKGEIRARAERGEFEPWAYPNGCLMGHDGSPKRCRYVYGFYAWKMGLRGLCPWIYTTNNGKGNPFNDFDRDYPDTGFVMPGPDGIIKTVRWDGAREGIDDMKYIYTLSTLIDEAKQSKNAEARRLGTEAAQSLSEMKEDVPQDYMGELPDLWTVHNTQAYRWYIATLIMKLQAAVK